MKDERMRNAGVQDKDLMKNLGLFAVALITLLILASFYLAFRQCAKKFDSMKRIKMTIERHLFFGLIIRYMIVSNIKLTFTIWAFLIGTGSFVASMKGAITVTYIVCIMILWLWPLVIFYALMSNYTRLEQPKTMQKFGKLY